MDAIQGHILLVFENKERLSKIKKILQNLDSIKSYEADNYGDAINSFLKYINNNNVDLVIIDNEIKQFNVFDLLKRFKRIHSKIGVILVSDNITKELSLEAWSNGANTLISLDKEESIIINIRNYFHGLQNDKLNVEIIQFLQHRKTIYVIPNSLKYVSIVAHHLTRDLAQVELIKLEDIENIKFGIQEMLINAIEHGNLEITFEQKSKLIKKGYDLSSIIKKYAEKKEFKDRRVTIEFNLTREKAIYVIQDQGNGFDHKSFLEKENSDILDIEHGRGIIMAKKYFDEFYYNQKGNEITMIVFKKALD